MLDVVQKHSSEVVAKLRETWFDEKYKFYHCNSYYFDPTFPEDTEHWHGFVSLDNDGNILGLIDYEVNRATNNVNHLGICRFTDKQSRIFSLDLRKALRDIFERFSFSKLNFEVIIGNPAEKMYDKILAKCGGRIVGVYSNEVKLSDNQYYDLKLYEITREAYMAAKSRKR